MEERRCSVEKQSKLNDDFRLPCWRELMISGLFDNQMKNEDDNRFGEQDESIFI